MRGLANLAEPLATFKLTLSIDDAFRYTPKIMMQTNMKQPVPQKKLHNGGRLMTHVLFVTTSFPDEAFQKGEEAAGGFVSDFAFGLAQYVKVTIVAPSKRNSVIQKRNLTICRFAVSSLPLSHLKSHNPAHWPKIIKTLRSGQKAVMDVARETAVDHIFALWALPSGYWAYRAKQQFNIPYSIWALGSDIWTLRRIPVVKNVLRNVLRNSTNRFADGFLLADDVKTISKLDCQFLPSSRKIGTSKVKKLATKPPYRLAFLGRWHLNKGIDLLMESLKELYEDDWTKIETVKICGGGPLEDVVKKSVSELQRDGYPVTLKGFLNRQKAAELLAWADYILLPSRIESIPVIFSDAMQMRCPIVTMPVGDLPRLMQTYGPGIMASEISSQSFTNALRVILEQSPISFGPNIQKACSAFKIESSVQQFLQSI